MSLEINLSDLATRIGTEFKNVRSTVGNNADLLTTAKGTLVAAINEIYAAGGGGEGVQINDATVSLTETWSSQRSTDAIDAAVAALVDSAPDLLDTLGELAAALGDDPNFATTIAGQIAGKADAVHTHTASQISDSTAVGRSVLTAGTEAAARTAIGAGTSNLVIGTTAGTAKDGAYQPAAANISDATATGRSVLTAATPLAARTTLDVYSKAEIGNPEADFVATFEAALA